MGEAGDQMADSCVACDIAARGHLDIESGSGEVFV